MILKGKDCTILGTIRNDNKIYDFGYDGTEVLYDKRLSYENHENTSEVNSVNNYIERMDEIVERIVFNKVAAELIKEYGNYPNIDDRIEAMTLYIGLLNQNLSNIKIRENLSYDFSTKEKAKETEEKFLSMCDDIFKQIDANIKSKINILKSETTMIDINEIKKSEVQVFGSTTINVSTIAKTEEKLDIQILRDRLTDSERELVSIYMANGGVDERTAMLMVYNERDSVKEYINDGYLLEDAIKESFKHTKVKVIEAPKNNFDKGYVDIFSLLIVGEVFIYGLIIAILIFIK